jgi:hypothetical protein
MFAKYKVQQINLEGACAQSRLFVLLQRGKSVFNSPVVFRKKAL